MSSPSRQNDQCVHLTYDADMGDITEKREIPFVIGVIGDFLGNQSASERVELRRRQFVSIDRENFDDLVKTLAPGLAIEVENRLSASDQTIGVSLRFESLNDFHPYRVAQQIPTLKGLLETRDSSIDSKSLDREISEQLGAVMHHPSFLRLEGSWRGLFYLVDNTQSGPQLQLRLLPCTKQELIDDFARGDVPNVVDRSTLYLNVYEREFGTPDGIPFAAIIGDFEFSHRQEDVRLLSQISNVAKEAFCSFIASPSCTMFGFDSWDDMKRPIDFKKLFESDDYAAWRSYRDTDASLFTALTLPRVLARLPYGEATRPIDEFAFEEFSSENHISSSADKQNSLCWMSSAFVLGSKLTDAFDQFHWCISIRGVEGGGKVDNLPVYIATDEFGDFTASSTEFIISEKMEYELSQCGVSTLLEFRNRAYSVFCNTCSTHQPKNYLDQKSGNATANAFICSRLPYRMATSRIAHYLWLIFRNCIGKFMEDQEVEDFMNKWIAKYVATTPTVEERRRCPLASARVEFKVAQGAPGFRDIILYVRPWLNYEDLTEEQRIEIRVPLPS